MSINPTLKPEDQELLRKIHLKMIEIYRSQSNFSQYSGDTESTVSSVLNGRRVLRPDQKRVWASLLNVNLDAFPDFKIKPTFPSGEVQILEHPGGVIPIYSPSANNGSKGME